MSVNQFISAFNKYLDDFVSSVIETFPEEKDFKLARSSLKMLKLMNENYPVAFFQVYIKGYEKQVEEADVDFFLKKDYSSELQQLDKNQQGEAFAMIGKIKEYWDQMSKTNQDKIWRYLQGLLKLSQKIPENPSMKLPTSL